MYPGGMTDAGTHLGVTDDASTYADGADIHLLVYLAYRRGKSSFFFLHGAMHDWFAENKIFILPYVFIIILLIIHLYKYTFSDKNICSYVVT